MKYWVNGAQSRTLRTLILKKGKNIKGTLNSNYVVKTNKESTTDPFHEQVKSTCPSESRYYIAQPALEHLILSHLEVLEIQARTTTLSLQSAENQTQGSTHTRQAFYKQI